MQKQVSTHRHDARLRETQLPLQGHCPPQKAVSEKHDLVLCSAGNQFWPSITHEHGRGQLWNSHGLRGQKCLRWQQVSMGEEMICEQSVWWSFFWLQWQLIFLLLLCPCCSSSLSGVWKRSALYIHGRRTWTVWITREREQSTDAFARNASSCITTETDCCWASVGNRNFEDVIWIYILAGLIASFTHRYSEFAPQHTQASPFTHCHYCWFDQYQSRSHQRSTIIKQSHRRKHFSRYVFVCAQSCSLSQNFQGWYPLPRAWHPRPSDCLNNCWTHSSDSI